MTGEDVKYFKQCQRAGLVRSRMLEVGSAKVQGVDNLCDIARQLGVSDTTGADIEAHNGVDLVFDFGLPRDVFERQWDAGKFSTVCIFSVLEHTFDPLTVLANALSCVDSGGSLIVSTPAIWPIHCFPRDYCRLLPDWYVAFAEQNNVTLDKQHFCWLSEFGIEPVRTDPTNQFPSFQTRGRAASTYRYWTSRIAHMWLNTYGRSHWAANSAIGATFIRP